MKKGGSTVLFHWGAYLNDDWVGSSATNPIFSSFWMLFNVLSLYLSLVYWGIHTSY